MEKLKLQPQVDLALGLRTTKREPINSSAKSIVAFSRNGSDTGSISTDCPSCSKTKSSSPASSKPISYWNPEHPPPFTSTRRHFLLRLSAFISAKRLNARSETDGGIFNSARASISAFPWFTPAIYCCELMLARAYGE